MSNLLISPCWTTYSSTYLCMWFFQHFSKIVKIKIKTVTCNCLQYINRIYYPKLKNYVMHTKINFFLKPLSGLNLFLSDSLNNPFELSVSSMFGITAEYIIAFNITHVPIYPSYGPLFGVIPGICVF